MVLPTPFVEGPAEIAALSADRRMFVASDVTGVGPLVPPGGRWRPVWTGRPWYRPPLHPRRLYEAPTRPGGPQGVGDSRFVAR